MSLEHGNPDIIQEPSGAGIEKTDTDSPIRNWRSTAQILEEDWKMILSLGVVYADRVRADALTRLLDNISGVTRSR